ncbi:MAG TPA: cupredoxin domain-containing protein [Steroidobacteraceae bacterium]|jgi:plastocyanin|nr:cupredoxin domain-containing protein [Steroidobacteraceae bacterium]
MRHFSRRLRIAAFATSTLAIASTATLIRSGPVASAAVAPAMKPAVTISGYSFQPATLTVEKGSTVIWINKDEDVHTIKSTDGPEVFNSPALDNGNRFGFTFHRTGTYHYICSVHPYMRGVVVVR